MPIVFDGLIVPVAGQNVLVYGPDASAFGEALFGPPVDLRPGYPMFDGGAFVLPDEAIDDVGRRRHDAEAYAWIEQHGDQFPRADAIGATLTGARAAVFLKELDLAEMAVFATPAARTFPPARVDLALEALAVPDGLALAPVPCPTQLELFQRAFPCYRLSPGAFGAVGQAIVQQLLHSGRRDWRLTFDELDDALGS